MMYIEALLPHLQGDTAFIFGMLEQRVKAVNFDVFEKPLKLIGYHIKALWTTTKFMSI